MTESVADPARPAPFTPPPSGRGPRSRQAAALVVLVALAVAGAVLFGAGSPTG